jgi:RNA polymerase sigma factor (sigma-70 family)
MTSDTLPRPDALHERLQALWERTNDDVVRRLLLGEPPVAGGSMATAQLQDDWLHTGLMTAYQRTGCKEVFALLFELNRSTWLRAIKHRLHGRGGGVEAEDILQEAVLNMMRYPHRFRGDHAEALRNWSHGIIRNTVATLNRRPALQPLSIDTEDASQEPQDRCHGTPERAASEHERAVIVDQAYLMFLALYLAHYQRLSPMAQRLLAGVEVEGSGYRELAAQTGLPVTNLKMVVFRGRRRIFRGMVESLAALERCEPVLEPLPEQADDRCIPEP